MNTVPEILRPKTVLALTGLTRTTLRRLARDGDFPKAIQLTGARAVGYCAGSVRDWIAKRKAAAL